MFQAGKGLLRSFKADTEAVADIVPVDLPVNMMITTAWHTVLAKPKDVPVYHCTTGGINPYTWGELGERYAYEWTNSVINRLVVLYWYFDRGFVVVCTFYRMKYKYAQYEWDHS